MPVDVYLQSEEKCQRLMSKSVAHSQVKENGRKQVRIDLFFTYVGQICIPLQIGREPLNESEPA